MKPFATRLGVPRRTSPTCWRCGTPTGDDQSALRSAAVLDGSTVECAACATPVRRPRVTLFGAPDGQELGRWCE